MINLVIIEDDTEFAGALQSRLNDEHDLACLAAFSSVEASVEGAPPLAPDVVLLDLNLPGESGIVGAGRLRDLLPGTRIVMLTVCDDYDEVFAALAAGADGYLLKSDPPERIIQGIREVADGGGSFSPAIARMVVRFFRHVERQGEKARSSTEEPSDRSVETEGLDRSIENLTAREEDVLRLAATGLVNKEIGAALDIAKRTVDAHFDSIRRKLRAQNKRQAVALWRVGQRSRSSSPPSTARS